MAYARAAALSSSGRCRSVRCGPTSEKVRQHLIQVHIRKLLRPLTPGKVTKRGPLTGELRAGPHDTWTKVGVDPDQLAQAVIGYW